MWKVKLHVKEIFENTFRSQLFSTEAFGYNMNKCWKVEKKSQCFHLETFSEETFPSLFCDAFKAI